MKIEIKIIIIIIIKTNDHTQGISSKDNVDRLYVPRKEGGRGLTSIKDCVDTSIRLEDYIEKHERGLITTIRNNIDNTIDNRMTKMGRKTTP